MAEFKLPDVGEGLTEAEIVSWKVKEGDTVEINDIIVEIETAKSLVELPSPYAGTVSALLVQEGETVSVGTPIIAVDDGKEPSPVVEEADGGGRLETRDMDLSNPAVAATQFTAYMALMNLTIAYSSWWQGNAAQRFGYPTTMVIDAALGCACLAVLPFVVGRPEASREPGFPVVVGARQEVA